MATSKNTDVEQRQDIPADVLQMGAERLTHEQLRSIESFDDAVRLAAQVHGDVQDYAAEYGSGFDIIDKSALVNKTVMFVEWQFSQGDFGGPDSKFVIARCVAKDGTKGIITDGSSGVCEQLLTVSAERGQFGSLMARKGLRVSEYATCQGMDGKCGIPRRERQEVCDSCGDNSTARGVGRTYYIDESLS